MTDNDMSARNQLVTIFRHMPGWATSTFGIPDSYLVPDEIDPDLYWIKSSGPPPYSLTDREQWALCLTSFLLWLDNNFSNTELILMGIYEE